MPNYIWFGIQRLRCYRFCVQKQDANLIETSKRPHCWADSKHPRQLTFGLASNVWGVIGFASKNKTQIYINESTMNNFASKTTPPTIRTSLDNAEDEQARATCLTNECCNLGTLRLSKQHDATTRKRLRAKMMQLGEQGLRTTSVERVKFENKQSERNRSHGDRSNNLRLGRGWKAHGRNHAHGWVKRAEGKRCAKQKHCDLG